MSSFLFAMTGIALLIIPFGLSWIIPLTFALLCIASNIDDLRKSLRPEKGKQVRDGDSDIRETLW